MAEPALSEVEWAWRLRVPRVAAGIRADLYKLIDLDSARGQQANLGIQPNERTNP